MLGLVLLRSVWIINSTFVTIFSKSTFESTFFEFYSNYKEKTSGSIKEKYQIFTKNYKHHFETLSPGQILCFVSYHLNQNILVMFDSGHFGANYKNIIAAYKTDSKYNSCLVIIQWKRKAPRSRPEYQACLINKNFQKVQGFTMTHSLWVIKVDSQSLFSE